MRCDKGGFGWLLCGIAVRVAQAIGLHRRSPEDLDLNDEDVRLRSQVWWVVYRLDGSALYNHSLPGSTSAYILRRLLSITQGRPAAVHPSTFDTDLTPMPSYQPQFPPAAALCTSASDVYNWSVKLSQIQHRFSDVTNQASTTTAMLDELGNIDRALLSWCNSIPIDCRPGEEILSSGNTGDLLVSLHLDYFNMMRTVHWASLTCAHAKRNIVTSHPNPRIRGSEAICLSAARSYIKTLNEWVSWLLIPTKPLAEQSYSATTGTDNSIFNILWYFTPPIRAIKCFALTPLQ